MDTIYIEPTACLFHFIPFVVVVVFVLKSKSMKICVCEDEDEKMT